jgi:drug/metabolite transporter (DMT)-like permease
MGSAALVALFGAFAFACATPLFFKTISTGQLSLVTPILAADGMIASALAVVTGDPVGAATALAIGLLGVGVVLIAAVPESGERAAGAHSPAQHRRAIALALLTAFTFGLSLLCAGRAIEFGPPWVVFVSRLTAALTSGAAVLSWLGRVPWSRELLVWSILVGVLDVGGALAYLRGADISLPLTAVMASQAAGIGIAGGIFLLKERLTRHQVLGVALIVTGIVWAAATQ